MGISYCKGILNKGLGKFYEMYKIYFVIFIEIIDIFNMFLLGCGL